MLIAPWAAQYVGLPFKNGGREREAGVDCYGLLRLVYLEQFGLELPLHVGYEDCHSGAEIAPFLANRMADWTAIAPGAEAIGDGVLLRCNAVPMHVGIVAGRGRMLHAFDGCNVCLDDYHGPRWNKRIIGFYRHARMM